MARSKLTGSHSKDTKYCKWLYRRSIKMLRKRVKIKLDKGITDVYDKPTSDG